MVMNLGSTLTHGVHNMARLFSYYGPLDIGSAFPAKKDLGDFVEYMINRVNDMVIENSEVDFIPPIVYSDRGRVFNIDYNFLVNCLDDYLDNVGIQEDFYLTVNLSYNSLKNCIFLICGIFDDYYDVVRIRQRSLNISKLKTNRPVEIKDRFYNVLVIENGENMKRFSAVPFSASEVKKIVSDSAYNLLVSLTDKACFEQIAFGMAQFSDLVRNTGIELEYVTN